MREVCAIRLGWLLGGLLALVAGAGCCECCKSLWKDEPVYAPSKGGADNQPSKLTSEQVRGGVS
jgi:hypothetical protein